MYIIELFIKIKEDILNGKIKLNFWQKKPPIKKEEVEKCDHFFVPIDSTKKILACSKCGMIYKPKKKQNNPFK